MTRVPAAPWLLRTLAILIAVAGAVDPAITTSRATKGEVAVVALDLAADSAEAGHVAGLLAGSFAVIRGPFTAADATVLVGDHPPAFADPLSQPVFAVLPAASDAATLDAVDAPAWAPLDTRVTIAASVHATGARGRTIGVTLRAGGAEVDHVTRRVQSDDERMTLPLTFAPTSAGPAPLHVTVDLGDATSAPSRATRDLLIDIRDTRWTVLFFDPRPSWMSTFVRRAIEQDPRFAVTSRVVTSRNISTDVGRPPGRLDDLAALGLFDAVVVGAPEALTSEDVRGLDAFLRRRGGSVVLLLDQRVAGPYDRLTDAGDWRSVSIAVTDTGVAIDPLRSDSGALRGTEMMYPAHAAAGSEPVAVARTGDTTKRSAVIWRAPVGAGTLIVSGAFDAWRYRDPATSSFDRFWQNLIAAAANAAPPPLAVAIVPAIVAPDDPVDIAVTLRDAALQWQATAVGDGPISASVRATMTGGNSTAAIRFWPGQAVGELAAHLRAPATPGNYRVAIDVDGRHVEQTLLVMRNASHPEPPAPDLLTAWVRARGGTALPATQANQLVAALRSAVHPAMRSERWHPMRSPWWVVPFALALSGEWWWRRRRGFA